MAHAHGQRHLGRAFVITNECPLCQRTFAKPAQAARHCQNAVSAGHCPKNGGHAMAGLTLLEPISRPICRVCGSICPTYEAYRRHVLSHYNWWKGHPRSLLVYTLVKVGQ